MTAIVLLDLKQRLARLSETQRRDVSAFLIRLGQETPDWEKETSRRLDDMARGNKTSVSQLRKQLGHA